MSLPLYGVRTLTKAINQVKVPTTFLQEVIFGGNRKPVDTDKIDVDVIVGGQKTLPYSHRGREAKILEKQAHKTQHIEPPVIRVKKRFKPSEMYFSRFPGEPIHNSGAASERRKKKIGVEQKDFKHRAERTIELQCAQALTTGGINITQGDGVIVSVDYQRPATHTPTLTGANKWTESTANPLKDIEGWMLAVSDAIGIEPDTAVLPTSTAQLLLDNKKFMAAMDNRRVDVGDLELSKRIQKLGAKYIGTIEGVAYYVYNAVYTDGAGTKQRMLPEHTITFAATAATAEVPDAYGIYFAAIEDFKAGGDLAQEYFSKDFYEEDPSAYVLLFETNPLAVLHYPEATLSATVA